MKSKKGQMNLDKIGKVMLVVLTIALISVVSLLIISLMTSTNVLSYGSLTGLTVNESGYINQTGYTLVSSTVRGFTNPTIVVAINSSSQQILAAGNYTISGNIIRNATPQSWNVVNMTYTYNYNTRTTNDATDLANNASYGNVTFFTNVPTIFTVLGVTAVIGLIGALVIVVRRLRERSDMSYT